MPVISSIETLRTPWSTDTASTPINLYPPRLRRRAARRHASHPCNHPSRRPRQTPDWHRPASGLRRCQLWASRLSQLANFPPPRPPGARIFGSQSAETLHDVQRDASPLSLVDGGTAPMLIIQGTTDTLVPPAKPTSCSRNFASPACRRRCCSFRPALNTRTSRPSSAPPSPISSSPSCNPRRSYRIDGRPIPEEASRCSKPNRATA